MPCLADIPVDVLLDNLLPSIPIVDVVRLGSASRFFAILCADDTFWKRRLHDDYNFNSAGTARKSGWKFIYQGLTNPRLFVWGEHTHGRLGLSNSVRPRVRAVPSPTELHIPGVRIVSLVAGGMSFHGLDSAGQVYVWGTLDGSVGVLNSDGFSASGKKASTPLRLELPAATKSISCGRLHSASLDINYHIWNFLSWGRPFRLVSPLLDHTSPDSTPLQIECGWSFSSVLTKSGDVLVWWPFGSLSDSITSRDNEMDREGGKKAQVSDDGVIPCVTWDLERDPVRLPALPRLPELLNTGESAGNDDSIALIKIAGADRFIIGLTNKGHVLKFGELDDETTVSQGRWEYLPMFSEAEALHEHQVFSPPEGTEHDAQLEPPEVMHITHISAHFQSFTAYSTGSSSIVLIGSGSSRADTEPTIIPELQNKSVISVVLGDYHHGAVTSTGKLLTWGNYSHGALGLGNPVKLVAGTPGGYATEQQRVAAMNGRMPTPPPVDIPTEVRFDHRDQTRKDRFCFAAAASGWHMGALVLDLDPDTSDPDDDEDPQDSSRRMPGQFPHTSVPPLHHPTHGPGELPVLPVGWGRGIFRVGFAGRGFNRGRGGSVG